MKFFAQSLFSWISAILVFVLVCAELGRLFPREVSGISLKIRRFTEEKKKVNIVFVGSSRIYHGISPKVFDQTLRATGRRPHSFNMGMDGMNTAEGFALVRRLLTLQPRKLKYVFFEVQMSFAAGTPTEDNQVKVRDVYWRDWNSLLAGFREFGAGMSWSGGALSGQPYSLHRWEYFGPLLVANIRLWVRNVTNFGAGTEILPRLGETFSPLSRSFGRKKRSSDGHGLPPNWDGYFAMSKPMTGDNLANYQKLFADAQNHPLKRPPELIMRSELHHFAKALARKKIQVVFVVPPSLGKTRAAGIDVPAGSLLFDYQDLARYPQFYEEDHRLDVEHLNARGAELFSKTLAEDFARTLPPITR